MAKVACPQLGELTARTRLFKRLDQLRRRHGVVWISAHAGSGKTSLAVSYLQQRKAPALWYRVDERDTDCAELFTYLSLAVASLEGHRRARVDLPTFSPRAERGPFSRRYFEALFARLPNNALVILDDYHRAPAPSSWHEAMERAIESLPRGINLLVLSREAPPASLARLLVHGEIGTMQAPELRISEAELKLMARARGPARRKSTQIPVDLAQIHATTRGWAAGVALLLRRAARQATAESDIDREADTQVVFDYFALHAFADLAPETQRLLLSASVWPSFSAAELEALTGSTDAAEPMRALHRSGFLLEREPEAEESYRLHPLFRAFLLHRSELDPQALRETRRRAAGISSARGRYEDAFELLHALGDGDSMRTIILERAPTLHAQGRVKLLSDWLLAEANLGQPDEPIDPKSRAWLDYWRWKCGSGNTPGQITAGFDQVLSEFVRLGQSEGAYLAWSGGVRALTFEARSWGEIDTWLKRLAQLEIRFPAFPSANVGLEVAGSLILALTLAGAEPDVLDRWAARALALAQNASDRSVFVTTASAMLLNHTLRGDAAHADTLSRKLQHWAVGPMALLARITVKAAAAVLAWHRAETEVCASAAREGTALMADEHIPLWTSVLLLFGCWAALDAGELGTVQRWLARLAVCAQTGSPVEVSAYHAARGREAMARNDLGAALSAFELALDHDRISSFPYGQGADLLAISFVCAELGRDEQSQRALAEAAEIEQRHREPVLAFWRALLEADRALRGGARELAVELARRGFGIARRQSIYNTQYPPPGRIADLCVLALEHDIEPEFVRALVKRRRLVPCARPPEHVDWPWSLRIRVLGKLEIEQAGAVLDLGKARVPPLLLQVIVALGGKSLSVERVAEELWPDADGDAALHSFEMNLSRLRKQLGPDGHRALVVENERIALDRSVCWTDVDALEVALAEGSRSSASHAPQHAQTLLSLYRGPVATGASEPLALRLLDERLLERVSGWAAVLEQALRSNGDFAMAARLRQELQQRDPRLRL